MSKHSGKIGLYLLLIVALIAGYLYLNDQVSTQGSYTMGQLEKALEEEKVTDDTLFDAIHDTYENRRTFIENMEKSHLNNAIDTIMKLINDCADHK